MKKLKDKIVFHLRQWKTDQIRDLEEMFPDENVEKAMLELQADGVIERVSGGMQTQYKVIEEVI